MFRHHLRLSIAALAGLAVLLGSGTSHVFAQKDEDCTHVEFGSEHAGSPFPPTAEHDQSAHGNDKIVPRTVVIERGGCIEFEVYPFHRPAVYEPGTTPADIELSPATLEAVAVPPCVPQPIPDFNINDPDGRLAYAPPQACEESEWTTPPGTFDQPGRYLVICATAPHFRVGMTRGSSYADTLVAFARRRADNARRRLQESPPDGGPC